MRSTTCLSLDAGRVFLLLLALVSAGVSALCVASLFEQLSTPPGMVILTVTVAKALVYTAINLLRLCMRRAQRVRVEITDEYAMGEARKKVQRLPKGVGMNSTKAREFWIEVADDLLGAVPAAVAVVSINSKQSNDTLFEELTAVTLTVLLSVAAALKLLRACNEGACFVKRAVAWRLTLLMGATNLLGLLASLANFVAVLLLLLHLLQVTSSAVTTFWLLPVFHIPVLQKSLKVRIARVGETYS